MARRLEHVTLVAVEPAPGTFGTLRQNLALHVHPGATVHMVQAALGAAAGGNARLVYYPHCPGNSTTRPEEKAQQVALMAPGVAERLLGSHSTPRPNP